MEPEQVLSRRVPPWTQTFLHKHLGVILTLLVTLMLAVLAGVSHTLDRVTRLEDKQASQEQTLSVLPSIDQRLSHIEGALGIGDEKKKGN